MTTAEERKDMIARIPARVYLSGDGKWQGVRRDVHRLIRQVDSLIAERDELGVLVEAMKPLHSRGLLDYHRIEGHAAPFPAGCDNHWCKEGVIAQRSALASLEKGEKP